MSSTLTNGMVLETMKKMGPSDGLTFLLEKLNQEPDIRTNRNNIGRRISRLKSKLKGLSTAPRAELLATKFDFKMSTPPAPVHVVHHIEKIKSSSSSTTPLVPPNLAEGMSDLVEHFGGCHCGAVRFQLRAPSHVTVYDCNCSICAKKQNLHFMVQESNFQLLQGKDKLTTYLFGTKAARHTFCQICGVQSFYTPRSNPDCYGVAPHCLDPGTMKSTTLVKYDGRNWEETFKTSDIKKHSKPGVNVIN